MTESKRRNPKQARSKATVDAILEAAFQVLEAHGLSNLTTSRIADRAGVSIGTLYQYFDDKDSILTALAKRQSEITREKITSIILDSPSPDRDRIRDIVHLLMHDLPGSLETRLILSDALFLNAGQEELSRQHQVFLESISGQKNLDMLLGKEAAFILTHAIVHLLRASMQPGLNLDSQVFEDELVHLMRSYIGNLAERAGISPASLR